MARAKSGFTLVELLVVIGIIAVLTAILFPVFGAVRKSAYKVACLSNLRQLLVAEKMYADDCDRTLVPALAGGNTWCVVLQPYLKNDKIIKCPADDKPQTVTNTQDLAHSYGINYNLTYNIANGLPYVYSMSSLNRTSDLLLFFDMKASAGAMGSSYTSSGLTRMDTRHSDRCGVGFLDGHGKMLLPKATEKPVNMWLPG